jgi:hypothetical protein
MEFFWKIGNIPIYEKKFWGKKVSDPYISENVKKKIGEKFEKLDY